MQGALCRLQPFQLIGPGQHAGGSAGGAAGHGAAPVDDLPVQRHDAEGITELTRHGDTAVQVLHYHRPAQQIFKNMVVSRVVPHQTAGDAYKTILSRSVLPQLVAPDGRQRQEGSAAAVPLLQELDGRLCVLLPFHHNVLQRRAQCRLQRHGIGLLCGHQSGHRPVNAPQRVFLRRLHHGLYRLVEALILLLHLRQQTDTVLLGVHLPGQLLFCVLGALRLLAAAVHSQAVTLNDILRRLGLLPGIVQRPAIGLCVLFALLQLTLCLGQLLPHRNPPLSGLVQARLQGGQRGAPVCGLGHSNGLLRPQGLGLVRRALCTVSQRLRPREQLTQRRLQYRRVAVDVRDTRQLSVDLSL